MGLVHLQELPVWREEQGTLHPASWRVLQHPQPSQHRNTGLRRERDVAVLQQQHSHLYTALHHEGHKLGSTHGILQPSRPWRTARYPTRRQGLLLATGAIADGVQPSAIA